MTSIIFASVSWKDDCDKGGLSLISNFYKVGFALNRPHRVKGSRFKRSPSPMKRFCLKALVLFVPVTLKMLAFCKRYLLLFKLSWKSKIALFKAKVRRLGEVNFEIKRNFPFQMIGIESFRPAMSDGTLQCIFSPKREGQEEIWISRKTDLLWKSSSTLYDGINALLRNSLLRPINQENSGMSLQLRLTKMYFWMESCLRSGRKIADEGWHRPVI